MGKRSIEFNSGYDGASLEHHLRELSRGRLPGKWGLLQDLVGHWAIPRRDRTWFSYGKAALDSLGTLLSYRDAQQQVVEGGRNPTLAWLANEGYAPAFPRELHDFTSFVRASLADADFSEKRIRTPLGTLDEWALRGFELDEQRTAYFLDPNGGGRDDATRWFGPYCKPADLPALQAYLRETIWGRLDAKTLLLEHGADTPMDNATRLSPVPDAIDFVSAQEHCNDVAALSARCLAFLSGGRSRTLLLHGPPGTGKSTLARALARELNLRLVLIAPEAAARLCDATMLRILETLDPGVIVLNDVDRTHTNDHLALLHGLEQATGKPRLTVLTANDLGQLDPAVLRPGRVHEVREIPEPSRDSRAVILRYYATKLGLTFAPQQLADALDRSDGFSPADLRELCETAAAVGVSLALEELDRIAAQRALYAGDACQEFNQSGAQHASYRSSRRRRRRRVRRP